MKGDARTVTVPCTRDEAFQPIERIGGHNGYYYGQWLWRSRALIDRIFGGPGLRPGRRHPDHLAIGDAVDCWEVVDLTRGQRLRLEARMKMPGRGWLEFGVREVDGGCVIDQSVTFEPHGVAGLLYWAALYPIHILVWAGMLRGIARAAVAAREVTCAEARAPA